MDRKWKELIWQQFGAAIDALGQAMRACPDSLWRSPLWDHPGEQPVYARFWYLAYHTLFWLDLYLSGAVKGFTPPAPYTLDELDPQGLVPEKPYTRDELLTYLAHCREKGRATIEALTGERALEVCRFGWGEIRFAGLLLYTMRHVQEHAAQLNLFLGQSGVPAPDWVARAGD